MKQSENILNQLNEVNYELDSNLSIDDFCKEELVLETAEIKGLNDCQDNKDNLVENTDNACEHCGKYLSNKITKARHIKLMHEPSSNVLCDECPSTFKTKLGLTKHRKIHQKNRERKYACRYCDLKFFSSSNRCSHELTHTAEREKKFKCDQCEKAFFEIGALNIHKRVHTGEMQQCVICEKRYPRVVDLNIHMRTHTNDRPFECTLCKQTFISSSTLGLHVRKEHLGFKFKCNICSKRFTAADSLKQHKAEHNTFPYVCALCNLSFVKRFFLHRHLRRVHDITKEAELKQFVIVGESTS